MFRILIILHRYLGIAIGIVLLLWCLTGFVMMYVQYPELNAQQQRQILPTIQLGQCCRMPEAGYMDRESVDYFSIEMVADIPVIRLGWYLHDDIAIDLNKGQWLDRITENHAFQIANKFKDQRQLEGDLEYRGTIHNDQWTVYGGYNPHRPLHHFVSNDKAGTEWYISSTSGEIVQITTAHQRFWNWIGSVSHWLYFTKLRENTLLWSQVVIWLTIIGIFLIVIGIYIGIKQFKFRTNSKIRTPYKGWAYWHHYVGLIFGLFTLTWVVSGFFSMNPWGTLDSSGHDIETKNLTGQQITWNEVKEFVHKLPSRKFPEELVQLEVSTLFGKKNLLAHYASGLNQRLNIDTLVPEEISADNWQLISKALQPNSNIAVALMIENDDTYYYNHHALKTFPVWRVIIDDADKTRYYLDPLNGQIIE